MGRGGFCFQVTQKTSPTQWSLGLIKWEKPPSSLSESLPLSLPSFTHLHTLHVTCWGINRIHTVEGKKFCTCGNEECSLFAIWLQHISIAAGFHSSKVYHPSSGEVATEVVSHTKITTRPRINEWLGCWCRFLEMFYAIKHFVLARLAL